MFINKKQKQTKIYILIICIILTNKLFVTKIKKRFNYVKYLPVDSIQAQLKVDCLF